MKNLLDLIWGPRYPKYTEVDRLNWVLEINQFEDDSYWVILTLEKVVRVRRRGPKWARREKFQHWVGTWDCPVGIPFRKPTHREDRRYCSTITLDSKDQWERQILEHVRKSIIHARAQYGELPEKRLSREVR